MDAAPKDPKGATKVTGDKDATPHPLKKKATPVGKDNEVEASKENVPNSNIASEEANADEGRKGGESGVAVPKSKRKKSACNRMMDCSSYVVTIVILVYFGWAAYQFWGMLYPTFPDVDPVSNRPIKKFENLFKTGDKLRAKVWVDDSAFPSTKPYVEVHFVYDDANFSVESKNIQVNVTQKHIQNGRNIVLSAEILHIASRRAVRAQGNMFKSMPRPTVRPKFRLLNEDTTGGDSFADIPKPRSLFGFGGDAELCPEVEEPRFGKSGKEKIARGVPEMHVRLVYDTTRYPAGWVRSDYTPALFVDLFAQTDDSLIKFNKSTSNNTYESQIHFGLMSSARWRFQSQMQLALDQNAAIFGEDSEELLQMKDLFANTNGYLLLATMVVSVLHLVFEYLAFKNDVVFWQNCDSAQLNKYMSIQSLVVGIVFQIILLLYLWDESSNLLVMGTSAVSILIDVWKVQRAMRVIWVKVLGVLPVPWLQTRNVAKEKSDDFDSMAMKYLALGLAPCIAGYAGYSLVYDCHRGWYSYCLSVGAACVYSLGFVLMTPQVFINYKHKSVAFLPWRKFVYRAINTFIDDLFALIIRMPTMHRLSAFRDDVVFFVYLYQRHLYPVDKNRCFDEDGYELSQEEVAAVTQTSNSEKKEQ